MIASIARLPAHGFRISTYKAAPKHTLRYKVANRVNPIWQSRVNQRSNCVAARSLAPFRVSTSLELQIELSYVQCCCPFTV